MRRLETPNRTSCCRVVGMRVCVYCSKRRCSSFVSYNQDGGVLVQLRETRLVCLLQFIVVIMNVVIMRVVLRRKGACCFMKVVAVVKSRFVIE